MIKLIVLLGPTASGKTAWSIALAKRFNGEIVSADSRQVYRGMDIGTAKDKNFPQHLLDIIDPDETMSVAAYKELAAEKIREIAARGNVPFLVGGTAQYLYAILDNWDIPDVPPHPEIRKSLESKTLEDLQSALQEKDPDACVLVDMKNKRRVIRALEVVLATGKLFSAQRTKGKPLFDVLRIGIDVPREELHRRIEARVDEVVRQGLVSEVERLKIQYGWDAPGMNGIGYRQFKEYTEGKETLAEATLRLKHDTRDVAKRQMTWFRKDTHIHWVHALHDAESLVHSFLSS